MVAPNRVVGGVDDPVAISVGRQLSRRAEGGLPEGEIGRIDDIVVVVVAGQEGCVVDGERGGEERPGLSAS